jgi:hypothetical protein
LPVVVGDVAAGLPIGEKNELELLRNGKRFRVSADVAESAQ